MKFILGGVAALALFLSPLPAHGAVTFELTFQDVIDNNNIHWDDPAQGVQAQTELQQRLNEFGQSFTETATIHLRITGSQETYYAAGGPATSQLVPGGLFRDGSVYIKITRGIDINGNDADGSIDYSFPPAHYANYTEFINNIQGLTRHELMHVLGSISALGGPGPFYRHDKFLFDSAGNAFARPNGLANPAANLNDAASYFRPIGPGGMPDPPPYEIASQGDFSHLMGIMYPYRQTYDANDLNYLRTLGYLSTSRGDFNRDGAPDYVLFKASSRQTAIWRLNNQTLLSGVFGPSVPAGWNIAAVADFDRDGNADYALFNTGTRQTAIWYIVNSSLARSAFGPTIASGYELVATGDFNGDGKPDFVLYNPSTRATVHWLLNDNVFVSGRFGPTLASGFQLVAVADFDASAGPDYVLFNPTTRQTAIWYLVGSTFNRAAAARTIASGYVLRGVADLNRDGHPDFVLFNPGTRQTAIWRLINGVYDSAVFGPTLASGYDLVAP